MVIEVLNVTLNLKHLFNNNVTILQSEKNPSQSHQSETQKNQCYLLLYINWLKPKTQQAKRNVEWIDFGIEREKRTRESDRTFWRRWASSAGWLVLVNYMGLSLLMVVFQFLFWVYEPFTSFISLVLGHKIYRPQIQFIQVNIFGWWFFFFFLVTRKFH